jgi:hypothetical protein
LSVPARQSLRIGLKTSKPVKIFNHDGLVRNIRWNLHQLACSQDHLFAADLELQRAADAVAERFAVWPDAASPM